MSRHRLLKKIMLIPHRVHTVCTVQQAVYTLQHTVLEDHGRSITTEADLFVFFEFFLLNFSVDREKYESEKGKQVRSHCSLCPKCKSDPSVLRGPSVTVVLIFGTCNRAA